MGIGDLLEPGRVLCNVEARSKKHALEILSELLATAEHDLSSSEIFDHLVARERLGSTGLGDGVALPHGRAAGLDSAVGAFVRLCQGVEFEAADGEPASLVFGILVPEDANEEHLRTLSAIAKRFLQPGFRAQLIETTGSRDLYDLLAQEPEEDQPDEASADP